MIYCATCSTANREGSKFCNECGANLQTASLLRCPNCGDMNPSSHTNCMNCGAALVVQAEPEPAPDEAEVAPIVAAAPTAPAPAPAPAQDDELPAWMHDLHEPSSSSTQTPDTASTSPPPSVLPTDTTPVSTDEAPLPLAEQKAEPAAAKPVVGDDELPDWLREFKSADRAPARPAPTPVEPDLPSQPKTAPPAPVVSADMPEWLKAYHTGEPAKIEPAEHVPAASAAPEWLTDLATPATAASREPAETSAPPEWMKEGATAELSMHDVIAEEPAKSKPVEPPLPGAEALAPGQIPAWLEALRPGAREAPPSEAIERSGLLAGIRGALPVETVVTRRHSVEKVEPAQTSLPVSGFAELYAPQPPPPPPTLLNRQVRRSPVRVPWLFWLVLILFGLVVLAFLPIPFLQELRGANLSVHQPSSDYYQTIEALRPNQIVMVAFDYTGGSRAELDPQARATLLHLFQNKQHILTLSFVPDGGPIANDVLAGLNPANSAFAYPYTYGDTHLNLGYQSSGDAALKNLTQSAIQFAPSDFSGKALSSWPVMKNLKSIGDVALLIVLSDDASDVRRWVEQVQRTRGKPLVAGVSAAAGPAARPYYDSKQLSGLLEGARGSAEYEVLLAHPSTAAATQDAISYVVVALVVIILLGIVVALLRRRSAPRQRRQA